MAFARSPWLLSGGLDYTPAYYRRGYLQDNSGLLLQPFLTLGCSLNPDGPVVIQPYVTSWNSFGLTDLNNPMATMVEGMAGVFASWNNWSLDVNWAVYNNSPMEARSTLMEVGARLSYDLCALWRPPGADATFSLRPSAALFWEVYDQKGGEDGYWELGLEPSWRLQIGQHRIGLALPVQLGFSARDYYFNSGGEDQLLGYVSTGLSVSTVLPQSCCGGRIFLTGSVQYTRLVADNLISINHGEANVVTGRVGIGFSF